MDGQAFGAEIVEIVKGYVDKAVTPLLARIDGLEQRIKDIPDPVDLSDDLAALKTAVEAIVIPELPALPEIQLPDIPAMVDAAVDARLSVDDMEKSIEEVVRMVVAEIPAPKDGIDGKDTDPEFVRTLVEEAVKAIPAPKDGKSVTVDDVAPLIAAEVEKRVSELPTAKDGKDGADGKDGIGLAGALIDRSGELVVTLTNGEAKNLGPIVGKDGDPGKPGKDGFSLKHFDAELMADGRTILLKFEDGSDQSYSVEIGVPTMIYRGVFKEGETYEKGDTVTWGGSIWHCDQETTEKPDASKAWRLAVKRGRDGKDGVVRTVGDKPIVSIGTPSKKEGK
ncbi:MULTISPECIES: hypothetical protein [unclassified Phyllobacterium]|uniref:hypothetical protein n=1 Tax=unclassified Phyllobacterium TaxID=2638441 RepID=UPI0030130461